MSSLPCEIIVTGTLSRDMQFINSSSLESGSIYFKKHRILEEKKNKENILVFLDKVTTMLHIFLLPRSTLGISGLMLVML